ncbi:MAG: AMP-dependent synthetase/ligase [Vulcanimicrobiaceae bacterium]
MSQTLPEKQTLTSLIRRLLAEPRDEALLERVAGRFTATSSAKLLERALNIACAIRDCGLQHGDRVALVSHDCVDWIACDFATFFAGCVVVPIYPTQALDQVAYILRHCEAKLLFVDRLATLERIRPAAGAISTTVAFDAEGDGSLHAFETRGAAIRSEHPELPQPYESVAKPDDLAVLIYTSGTTGDPKGVMLSHDNLAFDAQSSVEYGLATINDRDDVLSVLPFSHIYEHTMVYMYLVAKVRYFICHDPDELIADLRDVRPAGMTCVPRIFDRVVAGIKGQAMKAGGMQGRLVPWALAVGREYMRAKTFGPRPSVTLSLSYALARRLVIEKIRARLGIDRVKYFTSGSAALHIDSALTFLALGTPIMQGYGLTETSPVISVNSVSVNRYGSVGRPIPGVEVRIADDGEILTRGRNVMLGYYRDPDSTAVAIESGWLHTGDVGHLDSDGFLHITDRKKEVFKTATGKWVSPARVESSIKRSVFVSQVLVVGDNRPYPIALVCPNWDLLRVELSLPDTSHDELAERDDVDAFLRREVEKRTHDLASYERVRRVVVVAREFSVESGELSPAMKVKRRVVERRYAAQIEFAYQRDMHAPERAHAS